MVYLVASNLPSENLLCVRHGSARADGPGVAKMNIYCGGHGKETGESALCHNSARSANRAIVGRR